MDQSLNMVKIAYDALDDKLAEDIKIIDIRSILVLPAHYLPLPAPGFYYYHLQ